MKEIQITHEDVLILDDKWFELFKMLEKPKIKRHKNGYKTVTIFHVPVYKMILGTAPKGFVVDHINRNTLDNRKCNLRFTTRSNNSINRNPYAHEFKCANYNKHSGSFRSEITKDKKTTFLLCSRSQLFCAIAYNIASKKIHKDFGVINKIIGKKETVICKKSSKNPHLRNSPFRGVRLNNNSKKSFKSEICINGKSLLICNNIEDEVEAAKSYDKIAYEWFGINAILNFPKEHLTEIEITEQNYKYYERLVESKLKLNL